eukprot:2674215-Rhodomonas_salina.2
MVDSLDRLLLGQHEHEHGPCTEPGGDRQQSGELRGVARQGRARRQGQVGQEPVFFIPREARRQSGREGKDERIRSAIGRERMRGTKH